MSDLAWIPTSCALPTAEQPLRVNEWDALFSAALTAVSRPGPLRLRLDLRLDLAAGAEPQIRDLVARESACCSFFTFTSTPAGENRIRLDISVDSAHQAVLDALAGRTAAVLARP